MHGIGQKNRQRIGQAGQAGGEACGGGSSGVLLFRRMLSGAGIFRRRMPKADGSAMEAQDYEALLDAPEGGLQITFSFLTPEKRGGDQESAGESDGTEGCREEDNVGSTGMQGETRRGV